MFKSIFLHLKLAFVMYSSCFLFDTPDPVFSHSEIESHCCKYDNFFVYVNT